MSQELDKELVKDIIPYFHDNTFSDRFEHMTRKLSKSRRFLVKMEVNRLHTDCHRSIDLRGKVESNCNEYQHQGLTHHLDSVAIDAFEEAISVYTKYTTGVFEEVTNTQNSYREKQIQQDQNRRVALTQQSQLKSKRKTIVGEDTVIPPHHVQTITLTDFKPRIEERINVLAQINVRLANGRNVQGLSSNLSVHGAKIKLSDSYNIDEEDILYISYSELTQEDSDEPLKLDIPYTVISHHTNHDSHWFSLSRQHQDQELDVILARFIKLQRKNVATDVEHVIGAVRSLGYQQLYMNRIAGLPIFFGQEEEQYQALFALCNCHNRQILNYWRNQQNQLKIVGLFTPQRLAYLTNEKNPSSAIIYCFTHISKGKKYFYSAADYELEQQGLTDLFFQFGAGKNSWKAYQLHTTTIVDHHWQLPDVLPQHLVQKEQLTLEQHKHLLKLHNISMMSYLIEISDQQSQDYYKARQPNDKKINQLQQFGHSDAQPVGLDIIETNNQAQRCEDRFNYQTKVIIDRDKKQYIGATADFSVHGMQVNMKHSIDLGKGEVIKLEMPLLEKVSGKKEFAFLQYEVMRVTPDGRTLNLRIKQGPEFEHGPKLIYRIIKKNQHRLSAQVAPPANLTKSINLFYCHHIDCLPLVIAKSGNSYKISHAIHPTADNSLFNLFNVLSSTEGYCNVSALSQQNTFKEIFGNTLKQLTPFGESASKEVYIQLVNDPKSHGYRAVTSYFEQFESIEQHREFIKQAKSKGQLFIIRIMIGRCQEVNYKQVSREIIYAAKQASFKTRQLQAELDSVIAIAELVDISDEINQRFML